MPVGSVNTDVIEEFFRRLVLTRPSRAERLSEEFRGNLLSWVRSGAADLPDGSRAPGAPGALHRARAHAEQGRTSDAGGAGARRNATGSENREDRPGARSPGLDPRGDPTDPGAPAAFGPVLRRPCEPETQGDAKCGKGRRRSGGVRDPVHPTHRIPGRRRGASPAAAELGTAAAPDLLYGCPKMPSLRHSEGHPDPDLRSPPSSCVPNSVSNGRTGRQSSPSREGASWTLIPIVEACGNM